MMKTIVASHNPHLIRLFDEEIFRRSDVRLVTVRSSRDLIERMRHGADLCFVDRDLPDGDAASVASLVHSDRALSSIPLVLLVDADHAPHQDDDRSQSFDEVIALPAPPGTVEFLVARLLGFGLRKEERFLARVRVFGRPDKPGDHLGTTVDLSEGGMLLKSSRPLPLGTELEVRFTLPGLSSELRIACRVLRVDQVSYHPSYAVALEFESIDRAVKRALENYLRGAIAGRPFEWQLSRDGDRHIVSLFGYLRSISDLGPLSVLRGDLVFNLRAFHGFRSDNVQRWIEFVRSLEHARTLSLVECPIPFVQLAGRIPALVEGQEVISFYAPYTCERCHLESPQLITVKEAFPEGEPLLPPRFFCSVCEGSLLFDDLPEQYLAFLDR